MTIYHRLMDPGAFRDKTMPSADSLYEEGQALMFGGADTVDNTLMVGTFHLLKQPKTLQKLKMELLAAWPSLNAEEPALRNLEILPYLNAVIKESLRLSSGVTSGLLRVVPATGAAVTGVAVPPDVCLHSASNTDALFSDYFHRQLFRAVAHSCIITPRFSLSQKLFSLNAGWSLPSWTIGLLHSRVAHACVWESSQSEPIVKYT